MGKDPNTGKPVRLHVRRKTRKSAWEAVEALREQAKLGGGTAVTPKRATVAEWISEWLDIVVVEAKPRTWHTYESLMRTHVTPAIGHIALTKLSDRDVNAMLKQVATGSSGMVADNVRRTLRACLNRAVAAHRIATNPVVRSSKPLVTTDTPEALTLEQTRKLLAVARTEPDYYARWLLGILCGVRQGEVLAIRWTDIDLAEGSIKVARQVQRLTWRHGCPGGSPCGKRPASCPERAGGGLQETLPKSRDSIRTIFPPASVMSALQAHRQRQTVARVAAPAWQRSDLVFTTDEGRLIDPHQDWKRSKALFDKAGLPHIRVHTLRRTAVTAMVRTGSASPVIAAAMGWSASTTVAMLGRYTSPQAGLLKAASNALDDELWGLPGQVSNGSAQTP